MSDLRTKWTEEIDVSGRKFVIKHLKGSENDQFIIDTHFQNEAGDQVLIDVVKRNKFYFTKLIVDSPYDLNGKPWKELSEDERFEVSESMNHELRGLLIKKINDVKEGDVLKKKFD